jgi:hypothetical protein
VLGIINDYYRHHHSLDATCASQPSPSCRANTYKQISLNPTPKSEFR